MERCNAVPYAKATLRPLCHAPTLRSERRRTVCRASVDASVGTKTHTIGVTPNVEDLPLPGGTFGLPLFGESIKFMTDENYLEDQLDSYGPVFKSNLFLSKTIYLNDVDVIEQVDNASPSLVECTVIGAGIKVVGANSLLSLNGPKHAFLRRLLMKAFSTSAMDAYREAIDIGSQESIAKWASKDSFLFVPEVKKYVFELVANRVVGLPLGKDSVSEVLKIFEDWWGGLLSFGIDLPFTKFGKSMKAREKLIDYIRQGMDNARANGTTDNRALPLLLNARDEDGRAMSEAEIEDTVLLLLAAGYDTTVGVIVRTFRNLSKHPQVLEKALEEQQKVVSEFGNDISKESLAAMPYLEAILKETMRIDPPAPVGLRRAVRSFEIDGYKVPKGWQVIYGLRSAMTLNESEWVNGKDFDPERWFSGKTGAFLAFGLGAHACIGQVLSTLQMKNFFARLLRSYDFRVENPSSEMTIGAMPEPVDGMPIEITRKDASKVIKF